MLIYRSRNLYSNIPYFVMSIWGFLMIEADLKVTVSPYIHWIITLFIMGFLSFTKSISFNRVPRSVFVGMFLFIISIGLSGVLAHNEATSIQQIIKYSAIFFTALLLLSRGDLAIAAVEGFKFAPIANAILLLLGLFFGLYFFAELKGAGRWGTFFNYPGSLWKVGMVFLCFALYCLFHRKSPIFNALILLSSLLCVYLDNSRTAVLSMVFSGMVVFVLFFRFNKSTIRVPLVLLAVTTLFFFLAFIWQFGSVSFGDTRISSLAQEISKDGLISGVGENDPVRRTMNEVAIAQIERNPFTGLGFGNTKAETSVGTMVVHNSYTQSWADLGLLGITGFMMITFSWIFKIKSVIYNFHRTNSLFAKALIVNSVFVLINYNIIALLHPLSSEWSEWSIFIVFNAILFFYADSLNLRKERE